MKIAHKSLTFHTTLSPSTQYVCMLAIGYSLFALTTHSLFAASGWSWAWDRNRRAKGYNIHVLDYYSITIVDHHDYRVSILRYERCLNKGIRGEIESGLYQTVHLLLGS